MALQEQLSIDLKESMKSGDKGRVSVLRMAKSAMKYAEIDNGSSLDDAAVIEVLSKEAKKRRESITEFKNANRQEALATEEAELAIILEYLPQQMSESEITEIVRKVLSEVGAQGPKDKGKVMPQLMPQVKGKADGKLVNEVVTRLLEEL